MSAPMYYQCRMRNKNAETVGWIESRGAKVGAKARLLSADGEFWRVVEVYRPGIKEDVLRAKQANDRNSLPSIVGR